MFWSGWCENFGHLKNSGCLKCDNFVPSKKKGWKISFINLSNHQSETHAISKPLPVLPLEVSSNCKTGKKNILEKATLDLDKKLFFLASVKKCIAVDISSYWEPQQKPSPNLKIAMTGCYAKAKPILDSDVTTIQPSITTGPPCWD